MEKLISAQLIVTIITFAIFLTTYSLFRNSPDGFSYAISTANMYTHVAIGIGAVAVLLVARASSQETRAALAVAACGASAAYYLITGVTTPGPILTATSFNRVGIIYTGWAVFIALIGAIISSHYASLTETSPELANLALTLQFAFVSASLFWLIP